MIITIALGVLELVVFWFVYKKAGREGWEGIIPLYNIYVKCEIVYGKDKGWKCLLYLVPFFNIYFAIVTELGLAKRFNKSTGFGIGLWLLNLIFMAILAFGDAEYLDGSYANTSEDFVSKGVSDIIDHVGDDKVCPNCGAKIAPTAKFCPSCGAKYEVKKNFCPNCGKEIAEGETFCSACGTKIE